MKNRVRAVIIKDDKLLLIKRFKNNEVYYVFPGGGVEIGESDNEALMRECLEEIGVGVKVLKKLSFEQIFHEDKIFFYLCDIVSGEIGTGDGPEYQNMSNSNTYEVQLLPLAEIQDIDIRPAEMINIISQIF